MIRSVVRRLPPLARRDRRIAELVAARYRIVAERDELVAERNELVAERDELVRAADARVISEFGNRQSFHVLHKHYRRALQYGKASGLYQPIWTVNSKLEGYRFARSHGLDVPETYGDYAHVSDVPWSSLPSAFVIKTNEGSTAEGVLPLIRRDRKYSDLLNMRRGLLTRDDIIAYLDDLVARKKVSAELAVEELLLSPHHDDEVLAPDVKLYCFYGEVAMVLCRLTNGTRNHHHFSYRYFDAQGRDLGEALAGHGNVDPEVPVPLHLPDLVEAAASMSVALKVPFVRLDFYERKDAIVFGEVTPSPGGEQQPRRDLDDHFGQLWKFAEVRLMHDLNRSGVLNPDFGTNAH